MRTDRQRSLSSIASCHWKFHEVSVRFFFFRTCQEPSFLPHLTQSIATYLLVSQQWGWPVWKGRRRAEMVGASVPPVNGSAATEQLLPGFYLLLAFDFSRRWLKTWKSATAPDCRASQQRFVGALNWGAGARRSQLTGANQPLDHGRGVDSRVPPFPLDGAQREQPARITH